MVPESRHLEVVKLLLEDSRIDPTTFGNNIMRMVVENGRSKIAKVLFQNTGVNPSDHDNRLIIAASGRDTWK